MADDKVYTPETIEDSPLPEGLTAVPNSAPGTSTKESATTDKLKNITMPRKKFADETIGSFIDTANKKIMGEFTFTPSGAIKIGQYEAGVSGEIAISPKGIIAKNKEGINTITLDGDTGDATFAGDVTVGGINNSLGGIHVLDQQGNEKVTIDKSGILVEDGNIIIRNNNKLTIVDSEGLISDSDQNFKSDQVTSATEISTDSTTFVDVPGSGLQLTLSRNTRVLVGIFAYGENDNFYQGQFVGEAAFYDDVVGGSHGINVIFSGSWVYDIYDYVLRHSAETNSNMAIIELSAGFHDMKLRYRANGGGRARLYNWKLYYVCLGR